MTRDEALSYQAENWVGYCLPDISIRLRMSVNGAAPDGLPEGVRDKTVEMLQARLDTWAPRRQQDAEFDEVVKMLVEVALKDVRGLIAA